MPTEQALILSAALPPLPAAQRRAAVGFAVEDRIAQPLDQVVVALGPVIAGAHVIVVAARRDIAEWRAAHGGPTVRLLPDVLALPVPAQGWAVWVGGARALVRLADGTGFAVPARDLPLLWQHGGCPEIALCGGDLPDGMTAAGVMPLPPMARIWARFDLGSGSDREGLLRLPRGIWTLAGILVVAAAMHLGLIWMDLATERRGLDQRESALRTALTAAGQPDSGNLDSDLAAALRAAQPVQQSGFLPVMAASAAALGAVPGVTLQALSWADAALRLDLQAPDLAGLQAAEAALTASGLVVRVGSAVNADGAAKVAMTVEAAP